MRKGDTEQGYHQSLIDIQPEQVFSELEQLLATSHRYEAVLIVKTLPWGCTAYPTSINWMQEQHILRSVLIGPLKRVLRKFHWHPAVDTVILSQYAVGVKLVYAPIRAERAQFRHAIQAHHYDAVIDAQGLLKALFSYTLCERH